MTISESGLIIQREAEVRRAFSPAAPITRRDLFAGRAGQLKSVSRALAEPGQHAVIYGERGVGKTSLATICADVARWGSKLHSIKVNCQSDDDFSAIWRKVFSQVAVVSRVRAFGFSMGDDRQIISSALQYLNDVKEITPDSVCRGMRLLTARMPLAIFLDEFDRVTDASAHRFFADALKTLSDEVTPATIILVGVADNVDELVREHASVQRAIVQVHMPRMSESELADIVTRGLASVDMRADESAVSRTTMLSHGLPHYTHLLAQNAAANAVFEGSDILRLSDVDTAIETAINDAQESIRDLCYRATYSPYKSMYEQILLACACAPTDEKGFFTAQSVRATLSIIVGKQFGMPQVTRHLNALAEKRGPALKKEKKYQQIKYRFIDPLMQPYVTMCGLRDGAIDSDILKRPESL